MKNGPPSGSQEHHRSSIEAEPCGALDKRHRRQSLVDLFHRDGSSGAIGLASLAAANAIDSLKYNLVRELSSRDLFAWIPVLLGIGIASYFFLPREPIISILILTVLVLGYLSWRFRLVNSAYIVLVSISLFVAGIALAKIETEFLSTVMLEQPGFFDLSGRISELSPSKKRTRIQLVDVTSLEPNKLIVHSVQLSAFNQHVKGVKIGDIVQLKARLEPFNGPLVPNGYDFRRIGFFDGISARGFVLGEVLPVLQFNHENKINVLDWINFLRGSIARRLTEVLPGQGGALAAALLVGDRSGIDEPARQALRDSGLAHILAISGLHMALVTSLIFGAVRTAGAFATEFSARYNTKKIAAATALFGAIIYLGLSGGAISAQRAFLMASVFLLAILFDRAALTMRNVAIAAILLLIWRPSSILTPGFQMSFMAVVALVAVYRRGGLWEKVKKRFENTGILKRLLTNLSGLALTSLVAGVATYPLAIHHFYQSALFGVLGNLAAMPMVAVVVMPMGILALVLMPFGLEALPLVVMELGLQYVLAVGGWVSGLSGAVVIVGQRPLTVTLALVMLLLSLCLLRTKLRFFPAAVFGILAFVALVTDANEDHKALIASDGKMVAIWGDEGLEFYGTNRNSFTAGIWLRAFADPRSTKEVFSKFGKPPCDNTSCIIELEHVKYGTRTIALAASREALFEICHEEPDILVSPIDTAQACSALNLPKSTIVYDAVGLRKTGVVLLSQLSESNFGDLRKSDQQSSELAHLGFEVRRGRPKIKRPWN